MSLRLTMLAGAVLAALAIPPFAASGAAPSQPRIVGGDDTTIAEWPWQVAIAQPPASGGDGFDRQFCGGSLIAAKVVVTAAHCLFDSGDFEPASSFSVIAGRTTLSSSEGVEVPVREVVYFVAGPGGAARPERQSDPGHGTFLYDEATSVWDVALLELASAPPPPAQAIQLATASQWRAGDAVWITGWGETSGTPVPLYADTLQEAEVHIVSDPSCNSAYGGGIDPQTMVCAGEPTGGKDTCQGDSGGPMVIDIGGGNWRLVGDTSFGNGCALPGFPGVYGRIGAEPMRSAVLAGAELVAGDGPPETRLLTHPGKRTRKRRAVFTFDASEAASFECTLDGAGIQSCSSPFSTRVTRRRHTFSVRATDAAGNADPTPATYTWKVRRKKRR